MAQPRTRRLLIAAMRGARKPEVIGKLIVKCSGVEGSNLQMIVAGGTPMYTRLYHGLSMFSNNNNGSLFFYTLREQVIITEEVTDFDIDGVLLVVGPTFHARSDIRNLIRSIPGFDGWTTAGKVAIVVNMLHVTESDSIAHGDHPATLRARISYYFSEEGGWLPENSKFHFMFKGPRDWDIQAPLSKWVPQDPHVYTPDHLRGVALVGAIHWILNARGQANGVLHPHTGIR